MPLKLAFVGFRHSHIYDLYRRAQNHAAIKIVAACEEDPVVRQEIAQNKLAQIAHDHFNKMLESVACDAVAIGDYYARRGNLAVTALARGKHVISDKPLCTTLAEFSEIEKLVAQHHLKIGCMLDLRDTPQFRGVREQIKNIGEIHAISFNGQHPLLPGVRPGWYFEPGKHGGTINDIAIHAIDIIPWLTGNSFSIINAARSWNAFAPDFPYFNDAGQMMLTMNNECGVLGDVSYFAPDSSGYGLPFYWRCTFWGRNGVLETSASAKEIILALNGENTYRSIPLPAPNPGGYLQAFLNDLAGTSQPEEIDTAQVLAATRTTLRIQYAADQNLREVHL
jgi:predicted dehydrogenase